MPRYAIASTDGISVNAHFGGADRFHIVEITEGKCTYKETRSVTPACNNYGHSEEGFDGVLNALSDCEIITVAKIGPGAAEYVRSKGREIRVYRGLIEDFLKELTEGDGGKYS